MLFCGLFEKLQTCLGYSTTSGNRATYEHIFDVDTPLVHRFVRTSCPPAHLFDVENAVLIKTPYTGV